MSDDITGALAILLPLGNGSVVEDSMGDVWQRRGELWCSYESAPCSSRKLAKWAPFEILKRTAHNA